MVKEVKLELWVRGRQSYVVIFIMNQKSKQQILYPEMDFNDLINGFITIRPELVIETLELKTWWHWSKSIMTQD